MTIEDEYGQHPHNSFTTVTDHAQTLSYVVEGVADAW